MRILVVEDEPILREGLVELLGSAGHDPDPVADGNSALARGVAPEIELGTIFKSVSFFLMACIVSIIILILFPQLALILPNLM